MKYKAIITDLDGTALDSPQQKAVSPRLKDAVAQLEGLGIKVCAATGRAESFAYPVLSSMGLTAPSIVSGGSRIIDSSGDELWGRQLNESQMREVIGALQEGQYRCLRNEWTEDEYLGGAHDISVFAEYVPTYIFVICFVEPGDLSNVKHALSEIEDINVIVASSHKKGTFDIHITHKDASKEHAVYELERLLGINKDGMIGVGDGHNDIHLFDAVGYKVAMANAVPELKEAADKVIGDVAEDGLARYFEELAKEIK